MANRTHDVIHHDAPVPSSVVLRPADRLNVIVEVLCPFFEISKVDVGQILLQPAHVIARELDEVGADPVSNSPGSAMQHEPNVVRLIEADFNEVIAGAERSKVIGVVRGRRTRVFRDDRLITFVQGF